MGAHATLQRRRGASAPGVDKGDQEGPLSPVVQIHAYVVVSAVYTFMQGGVAMHEQARMTVVLTKGAGG